MNILLMENGITNMKQEDKKLLFRYLSMALPYGVKAKVWGWDEEKGEVEVSLRIYSINTDGYVYFETNKYDIDYLSVEECRLYLRPMSSMTEEEENKYGLLCFDVSYYDKDTPKCSFKLIKWLLEKHFDFMGLIPMGLAIEVTD